MPWFLLLYLLSISSQNTLQYLQSASLKFLWLQTWSPASHWIGKWKHSKLYYQLWWCVHSYPQPHLWVPSIVQRQFYSAVSKTKQFGHLMFLFYFHQIHGMKINFSVFFRHLELAVWGEDANPSIVVIGYNDVTVHVDCHTRRALQLPWWSAPYTKPHLKLAVVGKHLQEIPKEFNFCRI